MESVADDEGRDEPSLDLGNTLDDMLGHEPAAQFTVLVVDPSAGGLQVYGPYGRPDADRAAAEMREQFAVVGLGEVSVHVLPLHRPGE